MTNASMGARTTEPALRGRLLYGPRRAARQTSSQALGCGGRRCGQPGATAGLQRHQRELPAQLGARGREKPMPKPLPLAKRAAQHAGHAREPLQIGERRRAQPFDLRRRETEQQARLVRALATRVAQRRAESIDRDRARASSRSTPACRARAPGARRRVELEMKQRARESTPRHRATRRWPPRSPAGRPAASREHGALLLPRPRLQQPEEGPVELVNVLELV